MSVSEPAGGGGAVALSAGQCWTPSRLGSRAKPRHIVWADKMPSTMPVWLQAEYRHKATVGYVFDPKAPRFPSGHDSWLDASGFRAWIRKHAAVASPPPLPIHLTRTDAGYWAASSDIRGVSIGTPTRAETLASIERAFRPWAGERGILVVDLTGEQG